MPSSTGDLRPSKIQLSSKLSCSHSFIKHPPWKSVTECVLLGIPHDPTTLPGLIHFFFLTVAYNLFLNVCVFSFSWLHLKLSLQLHIQNSLKGSALQEAIYWRAFNFSNSKATTEPVTYIRSLTWLQKPQVCLTILSALSMRKKGDTLIPILK